MNPAPSLILGLVSLSEDVWRQLTGQMTWAYRKQKAGRLWEMPMALASLADDMPTEEEWAAIRTTVRKRRISEQTRKAKAAARSKQEKYNAYMRSYMRDYRKAKKDGVPRPD